MQKRRSRIAAMVRELEVVGPNLAEVARRLGEPKESVSYAYRSNIEKAGYRLQARTNRGALGLREIGAVVDLDGRYASRAGHVFDGLDQSYITGFNRTLPDGKFILQFTLPEEHYGEFPRLLNRMKKTGFITKVHRTLKFSWRRHRPMRADLFDFRRGRWELDWTKLSTETSTEPPPRTPRQTLDGTDLAILGYYFADAAWPIKGMAKDLKISTKTVYRHLQHIADRHLIQSYGVNWMKAHMYTDSSMPLAPRHELGFMHVNVAGVNSEELARLSEKMNVLPSLWVEYAGLDYAAEIPVPLEHMVETMSYLREVLEPVADRSSHYMIDTACSRAYAPPRRLFDDSKGDWVFDIDSQMAVLEERLKAVVTKGNFSGPEGLPSSATPPPSK